MRHRMPTEHFLHVHLVLCIPILQRLHDRHFERDGLLVSWVFDARELRAGAAQHCQRQCQAETQRHPCDE
eukprot:365786-Chlamydomonas_euryale.AAC.7